MDTFYVVNAIRKIHHIKPSTFKPYQYLKRLDKNLEGEHFTSTLESLLKMVILQCKEKQNKNQVFQFNRLKIFQNISNSPQGNTLTEITELNHFFYSVEKCTHSGKNLSQANDNCGILYERIITDLQSEINTVRKASRQGVFSGPYFPVFGLNTEKYGPEKNSVFGHFSPSASF